MPVLNDWSRTARASQQTRGRCFVAAKKMTQDGAQGKGADIGRATGADCPETSRKTPVKAIRLYCLDCSGGSSKEVELCVMPHCALYPFRFGRNPFRAERSEAQKAAAATAIKKLNEARMGNKPEKEVS